MRQIKNITSLILFLILKFRFRFTSSSYPNSKKVLFMNLGSLGDVVMSSIIFSNEHCISSDLEVTYLVNEKFVDLFDQYHGNIKIIYLDKRRYRNSILFRNKVLKDLYNENFYKVFNFSMLRLTIEDEIALILGEDSQTYAFESLTSHIRLFSSIFDNAYTKVLARENRSFVENFGYFLEKILSKNMNVNLKTILKIIVLLEHKNLG